ncbi:hypothetical protein H1C71_014375, partial [Ictidomys tridecemlineatus]
MGRISSKSSDRLNLVTKTDPANTLRRGLCPPREDVSLLEPLICKKIAHERLTVLIFLEDCIVNCLSGGIYLHMEKAWSSGDKVLSFPGSISGRVPIWGSVCPTLRQRQD